MSIEVKTFDMDIFEMLIEECDPDVIDYIEALQNSLQRQKDLTNQAMKKIRELSNAK